MAVPPPPPLATATPTLSLTLSATLRSGTATASLSASESATLSLTAPIDDKSWCDEGSILGLIDLTCQLVVILSGVAGLLCIACTICCAYLCLRRKRRRLEKAEALRLQQQHRGVDQQNGAPSNTQHHAMGNPSHDPSAPSFSGVQKGPVQVGSSDAVLALLDTGSTSNAMGGGAVRSPRDSLSAAVMAGLAAGAGSSASPGHHHQQHPGDLRSTQDFDDTLRQHNLRHHPENPTLASLYSYLGGAPPPGPGGGSAALSPLGEAHPQHRGGGGGGVAAPHSPFLPPHQQQGLYGGVGGPGGVQGVHGIDPFPSGEDPAPGGGRFRDAGKLPEALQVVDGADASLLLGPLGNPLGSGGAVLGSDLSGVYRIGTESVNGEVCWVRERPSLRWIFSSPDGFWRFTDSREDFASGRGFTTSSVPHGKTRANPTLSPHLIPHWYTPSGAPHNLSITAVPIPEGYHTQPPPRDLPRWDGVPTGFGGWDGGPGEGPGLRRGEDNEREKEEQRRKRKKKEKDKERREKKRRERRKEKKRKKKSSGQKGHGKDDRGDGRRRPGDAHGGSRRRDRGGGDYDLDSRGFPRSPRTPASGRPYPSAPHNLLRGGDAGVQPLLYTLTTFSDESGSEGSSSTETPEAQLHPALLANMQGSQSGIGVHRMPAGMRQVEL